MKGYGQFCPVAKATEIIGERWTPLVLRELLSGSRHFGDLRRGVPLMSPSLLSTRLKSLEKAGVIERARDGPRTSYTLTPAGEELRPLIEMLGTWGQRWARSRLEEQDLDAGLLMWDVKRNIDTRYFPERRTVVRFDFSDVAGARGTYWVVGSREEADLCMKDPGYEVDLYVGSDLRTMVHVWMGDESIDSAIDADRLELIGDAALRRSFRSWFALSPLAGADRSGSAGQRRGAGR